MHWNASNFVNRMHALWGAKLAGDGSRVTTQAGDIRQAMLDCLEEAGCTAFPMIERRVRLARDVEGLWYLRGDMMAALSTMQGESVARKKINELTTLFEGLLPRGLSSRPSSLSDRVTQA